MSKIIPKGMKFWPKQADALPADEIVQMYESGFAGAWEDPEARQRLRDEIRAHGGYVFGADAAASGGFQESGAGKLVAPFVFVEKTFPGCWPGPAQEVGDCVSQGGKNSKLLTLCCEIVVAKPDEVTGNIEGIPVVSPAGILNGVLSTEWGYWHRRHAGHGWSCDEEAEVSIKSGMMLRQAYPELGIDLTEYSGKLASKFGRSPPPENMEAVGRQHLVRTSTQLRSFEEVRDFLHNGYGINSCGSEGFGSKRNEDGVADRKGSWAHSMAYIGADDRDATKQKYGGPLVLVLNSWGKSWIGGPRKIMGTDLEIPEGSFWARWKDISRRSMFAFSSTNGWPSQKLPDLGFDWS